MDLLKDHSIRKELSTAFFTITSLRGVDTNSRDMGEAYRYGGTGSYHWRVNSQAPANSPYYPRASKNH